MSEVSETCPVCKTECSDGATACSFCGFKDELGINRTFVLKENLSNWLETVVKPHRAVWEARKREAELLAQLEEAKKREAELLVQVEAARHNTFIDPRDGKEVSKIEVCPVCKTECNGGTTVCSVCGFKDELGINRTWTIKEDVSDWLETVVKPYRVRWEVRKRETELLEQLDEAKKWERLNEIMEKINHNGLQSLNQQERDYLQWFGRRNKRIG
jgi:transcription elongation factor Elf1